MLPLRAPLAFSVKLWPACPPTESPVLVSGTVESVEAIVIMILELSSLVFLGRDDGGWMMLRRTELDVRVFHEAFGTCHDVNHGERGD